MKYLRYIYLPFIFLFACTVCTGCSENVVLENESHTAWNAADAQPVYVTEWPDNEYTTQIVKPEYGEMDYIVDYSASGRYAVNLKNISEEESAAYVEELKESGYSEIFSEGNDASVGTMLKKDDVTLSIAYSGTDFGLIIMMDSDT